MAADQNERLTDEQVRELLDKSYPFVDAAAEPPGRFVPDPTLGAGRGSWTGLLGWRTRHGPAVIRWDSGNPTEVADTLLPDGSRGKVQRMLDHGHRRASTGARRWTYGTIDIRADDVVFTDAASQPSYQPPGGEDANLERDLFHDVAFLEDLQDDRFALLVYRVFANREFARASDLELWMSGDRQAARLVAGLRGVGESYQDYFLNYDVEDAWPEERERALELLVQMSERVATTAPDFSLSIGTRYRGVLIESQSQADAIAEDRRLAFEASRDQLESDLRQRKAELAAFRSKPLSEPMLRLRAHLARLGWRALDDADRRRMGADAMKAGLELLGEIRSLEKEPENQPGDWWAQRQHRGGLIRFVADVDDDLSPDEKLVRTGLSRMIEALAASGRIDEATYHALKARSAIVDARIGGFRKQ